jgi:hypothetical protein
METGGNEARCMANRTLRSLDQQINKLLLLCQINGEDVDNGDDFPLFADCGHALIVEKTLLLTKTRLATDDESELGFHFILHNSSFSFHYVGWLERLVRSVQSRRIACSIHPSFLRHSMD